MNAIAMLSRCRAHQDNAPANDGCVEPVAERPYFAPDIEPFIADVHPLPACSELAAEAARLGLTDG